MAVTVTLKGGEGSGNFNHAGRPGEVGGSGPGNGYKLTQIDIITGRATQPPDPKDIELLNRSIAIVNKTVPSLDTSGQNFVFLPAIAGPTCGAYTKYFSGPLKGESVIALSPKRIDQAIKDNDGALAGWHGWNGPVDHDIYLEHIIVHELGHMYWKQNGLESKWTFGDNFDGAPSYGRYYHIVEETFADTFANYVLGYNLPSHIEDWFMDNVK